MKISDKTMTRIEIAVFIVGLIVVVLDVFFWRSL